MTISTIDKEAAQDMRAAADDAINLLHVKLSQLANLQSTVAERKAALDGIEAYYVIEVSIEFNADGKPRYPNEAARAAAVKLALLNDERYVEKQAQLRKDELALMETRGDITVHELKVKTEIAFIRLMAGIFASSSDD